MVCAILGVILNCYFYDMCFTSVEVFHLHSLHTQACNVQSALTIDNQYIIYALT